MQLQTVARTDVGPEREQNEDAVLCHRPDPVDGWLLHRTRRFHWAVSNAESGLENYTQEVEGVFI